MKRAALSVLVGLAVIFALAAAEEKTLKGKITCAKCDLGKETKCTNVIVVKEDGKEVVYYFDDKGGKESYHKEICKEGKDGSVTGELSDKEGKKYVKPKKDGVKFDKK